ncbi:energy transducer TonB [Sphingomonas sp. M1-B02]|uniref:energy transducer TonB n=1 Tax=Sphingomonas sp. M1-B02 TaxID=3114300 RepID=UPI002240C9DC|nr:hypothetical protein [Sphingomonas sp. S6-11]UZK66764.1 hypothetical protein OKW87_02680 [Sphingomonas sp. S6-11]
MKLVTLGLLAAILPTLGATQDAPPVMVLPPAVEASPITPHGAAFPVLPTLIQYARTSLRCGDDTVVPLLDVEPFVATGWGGPTASSQAVSLRFRIDATGRPLGIERLGAGGSYLSGAEDLAPALAALRFALGEARDNCVVRFAPRHIPIPSAPTALLARYYGMPHRAGPHDRRIYKALVPTGADCTWPSPEPRALHYPPYSDIEQAPGTSSFIVLGYDLDARGKPVRVRTIASAGNVALDRASVAAIERSRFAPGARTGCVTRFYRRQNVPIPAPAIPEPAPFVAGPLCKDLPDWSQKPNLVFPDPYRRRAIEGWAIIGFDVAPWGATGNVRVLASEPSADFGIAAKTIVERARLPNSPTGRSGCAEKVRFLLPAKGAAEDDTPPPPIIMH